MGEYTKLEVWRLADGLARRVYPLTLKIAAARHFGLADQLRRAALSVPTNIVEGCGRNGDGDLARFAAIARGSAAEVEYLLRFAAGMALIPQPAATDLATDARRIQKMLHALIFTIRHPRDQ